MFSLWKNQFHNQRIAELIVSNNIITSLSVNPSIWDYDCSGQIYPINNLKISLYISGIAIPNSKFLITFTGWMYTFTIETNNNGTFDKIFELSINSGSKTDIIITGDQVSFKGYFCSYLNTCFQNSSLVKVCIYNQNMTCPISPLRSIVVGNVRYTFTTGTIATIIDSNINGNIVFINDNSLGLTRNNRYLFQGCGKIDNPGNLDFIFVGFDLSTGFINEEGYFQFSLMLDLAANDKTVAFSNLQVNSQNNKKLNGILNLNIYSIKSDEISFSKNNFIVPEESTITIDYESSINNDDIISTIPAFTFVGSGQYNITITSVKSVMGGETGKISLVAYTKNIFNGKKEDIEFKSDSPGNGSLKIFNENNSGIYFNVINDNSYDVKMDVTFEYIEEKGNNTNINDLQLNKQYIFNSTLNVKNTSTTAKTLLFESNTSDINGINCSFVKNLNEEGYGSFMVGRSTFTLIVDNSNNNVNLFIYYIRNSGKSKIYTIPAEYLAVLFIDNSNQQGDTIWLNGYFAEGGVNSESFAKLTLTIQSID